MRGCSRSSSQTAIRDFVQRHCTTPRWQTLKPRTTCCCQAHTNACSPSTTSRASSLASIQQTTVCCRHGRLRSASCLPVCEQPCTARPAQAPTSCSSLLTRTRAAATDTSVDDANDTDDTDDMDAESMLELCAPTLSMFLRHYFVDGINWYHDNPGYMKPSKLFGCCRRHLRPALQRMQSKCEHCECTTTDASDTIDDDDAGGHSDTE
ncbi:hypothetical protein BC831DRAFT_8068 [Entophlyctis helioformis]|nr:hypothetical protein BC831DRAFT_8068 [Entophlyctis helioformis]